MTDLHTKPIQPEAMHLYVTGPGGIDALITMTGTDRVSDIASRAAAQLAPATAAAGWQLARPGGTVINPTVPALDELAGADQLLLVRAVPALPLNGTTPKPSQPAATPENRVPVALPTAPAPAIEEPDGAQRTRRAAHRRRLVAAVSVLAVVLALGVIAGRATTANQGKVVTVTVTAPAPAPGPVAVVLAGDAAELGPVGNLSLGASARPGQVLTAPDPAEGTAKAWHWQRCDTATDCADIPGATDRIYTSPPTASAMTMRVVVTTDVGSNMTVMWTSAKFTALPGFPPTTTAPSATPAPDPTVAPPASLGAS